MGDWRIEPCERGKLAAAVALINSAYRGQAARAGWTSEADYMDGQRTSLDDLIQALAADTQPCLLTLRRSGCEALLACALVEALAQPDGPPVGFIGMVTVRPDLQASGIGRAVLAAAETHALGLGARRAQMTVISIRVSLIAWYERRGWRLTGERRPFPYGDDRFGRPRRDDLDFVVLEKALIAGD
jgi:GNAT superfamily N-acetyltransferase